MAQPLTREDILRLSEVNTSENIGKMSQSIITLEKSIEKIDDRVRTLELSQAILKTKIGFMATTAGILSSIATAVAIHFIKESFKNTLPGA